MSEIVTLNGYSLADTTARAGLVALRNLLDNSDFRNPVNQRGKTSYLGTDGYNIDRWKGLAPQATYSLGQNGLTHATQTGKGSYIAQLLENPQQYAGKTLTFAVNLVANNSTNLAIRFRVDGTIVGKQNVTGIGIFTTTFTIPTTVSETLTVEIGIDNGSYTVQWAALYEGSYTAETLPPYVPKGYAVELAECQRYYRKYTHVSISGDPTSERYLPMSITYPKMRTVPSVSFQSILTSASSATDAVFERAQASTDSLMMIVLVEGKSSAKYVYGLELNADL